MAYSDIASHDRSGRRRPSCCFAATSARRHRGYYKKDSRYPQSLEQLLVDKRYPMPVRHLRRLYVDPMTGAADWAVVEAPGGGVMGVYSRSEAAPRKTGNFLLKDAEFEGAELRGLEIRP